MAMCSDQGRTGVDISTYLSSPSLQRGRRIVDWEPCLRVQSRGGGIMNNTVRCRPFIRKESSTCAQGIQKSNILVLVFGNRLIEMTCPASILLSIRAVCAINRLQNAQMRCWRSGLICTYCDLFTNSTNTESGSLFVKPYPRSLHRTIQDGESNCSNAYCNVVPCALLCFLRFQFRGFSMDGMN